MEVDFDEFRRRVLADPEAKAFFEEQLGGDDGRLRDYTENVARRFDKALDSSKNEVAKAAAVEILDRLVSTSAGREELRRRFDELLDD